jgi:hypothetical protein
VSAQLAHVGALRAMLVLLVVAVATFAALTATFGGSGPASPLPQPKAVSSLERARVPQARAPAHAKRRTVADDVNDPYAVIARRERRRARHALAAARERVLGAGLAPKRRPPAVPGPAVTPGQTTGTTKTPARSPASSTTPASTSVPASTVPPSNVTPNGGITTPQ